MKINNITRVGKAGIRITTDEVLPNGDYTLDLHIKTAVPNEKQVESLVVVSALLKDSIVFKEVS